MQNGWFLKAAPVAIAIFAAMSTLAYGQQTNLLRVKGERVSLRSSASLTAEVVSRVSSGDLLIELGTEQDWCRVALPTNVEVWVSADFVTNGLTTSRLNLRSGPGLHYASLGFMENGSAVAVRSRQDNWLKILPPPGKCAVWINRAFIESSVPEIAPMPPPKTTDTVREKPDTPAGKAVPPPATTVPDAGRPKSPPPPAVTTAATAESMTPPPTPITLQTPKIWTGMLKNDNPEAAASVYYLVSDRGVTICTLKGDSSQLKPRIGMKVQIQGHTYWTRQEDAPLIVIETIADAPR